MALAHPQRTAERRAEQAGLGVAAAAHVLLFAALSLSFTGGPEKRFDNPPMAVDIIAETAPEATAPTLSSEAPAARLGDPDSSDSAPPPPDSLPEPAPEPVPAPPPVARPVPAPRPVVRAPPRPTQPPRASQTPPRAASRTPPRPAATPPRTPPRTPAQTPARPTRDPRPTGALDGIAAGVARDAARDARGTTPPATQTAAQVRRSISTSINGAVRGPWNACRVTGIDVDQLKTTVVFRLTRAAQIDRIVSVQTRGQTESNRPQVQRFEECARRAITVAAPFDLPEDNYDVWQTYTLDFEKR